MEKWKPVEGYEDYYLVSNMGRIKSLCRGIILKPVLKKSGYLGILFCTKNGKRKNMKIHRLVAKAFLPNPQNKPQVNHKNEDKRDNRSVNLEWVTAKENCNYGTRTERIVKTNKKRGNYKAWRHSACMCVETGEIFNSQTDAAKKYNTMATHVSLCCRETWRVTRGLHFRFI